MDHLLTKFDRNRRALRNDGCWCCCGGAGCWVVDGWWRWSGFHWLEARRLTKRRQGNRKAEQRLSMAAGGGADGFRMDFPVGFSPMAAMVAVVESAGGGEEKERSGGRRHCFSQLRVVARWSEGRRQKGLARFPAWSTVRD
ncbi:hypothetical protein FXO38_17155 [Capsicum annuum]|nr:hypothetical protein FXO38_17155 [Capsicum annuum]